MFGLKLCAIRDRIRAERDEAHVQEQLCYVIHFITDQTRRPHRFSAMQTIMPPPAQCAKFFRAPTFNLIFIDYQSSSVGLNDGTFHMLSLPLSNETEMHEGHA